MSSTAPDRWHRQGGGVAAAVLAVAVLGAGLAFGRADVAVLGLPIAATAALTLRRPLGSGSVAVAVPTAEDGSGIAPEVQVAAPVGTELVVVHAAAYEEPFTTVVVGPTLARSLVGRLPVLHSGPQEVVRVSVQLVAAGGDLVQQLGLRIARATIAPATTDLSSLLLPLRLSTRPGAHPARRRGEGLDFRDLAPFAPGDRMRRIDWRATARSGRPDAEPIVRRTDTSAEATTVIALDSRDDVGTVVAEWTRNRVARRGISSFDIARPAVVAIAGAYLEAGDRVAFHDLVRAAASVRTGGGRRKLEQIRTVVNETVTHPGAVLRAPPMPSAAIVYLLSTFLDDDVVRLAVLWRNAGHRVVAVDVLPEPDPSGLEQQQRFAFRIVQLERRARLERLRGVDVLVVRWTDPQRDALLRQADRRRGPR